MSKVLYALAFIVLRAFGWCFFSFSVIFYLVHGYVQDLITYGIMGILMIAASAFALSKAMEQK